MGGFCMRTPLGIEHLVRTVQLIRRRLATLRELVAEYELSINAGLVKSHDNRADQLTWVLRRWLEEICTVAEPKKTVCAVAEELDVARIEAIHQSSRHHCVNRTLNFVKLVNPRVPRAAVQVVVRECRECQPIDPAPGKLYVSKNWCRVGMDVTSFGNQLSNSYRQRPRSFWL